MAHRYQLTLRPFGFATVPKGFIPESAKGIHKENWSRYDFGSIAYPERLTEDQVESFDLKYLGEE
jgi:hypothetical protein